MAAGQTRDDALRELRATRSAMLSATWLLNLESEDEATQSEAARQLLRVNHAIRKLENAQLEDIRNQILENETELESARATVEQALENLNRVKTVLESVATFLGVIARVVALLA